MRKQWILINALLLCTMGWLFPSCTKDLKIGAYADPQPTSVYNLRRIEITETLKLGQTAFQAVVTSDFLSGNMSEKKLVLQDLAGEAAILVELTEINTLLHQNEVVLVNLEGATLQEIKGERTLVNIPLANITSTGQQRSLTPKSTNIAALWANVKYWGPLLVKLDKVNIGNGSDDKLLGNLLIDDEIAEMQANFLSTSVFASQGNPGFVESLIGLPFKNGNDIILHARNLDDLQVGVSELLEDFEQAASTNYDTKVMNFITGAWTIDGGITATSAADPKNGRQSIRLQGTIGNALRTGIIAMNFDLKAVKSISVSHGIYPAAAELANVNPTVFALEISRDGGVTYNLLGTVEVDTKFTGLKTSSFTVDAGFSENTRFRIVNTSIPFANNSRPRINIDDIFFKF